MGPFRRASVRAQRGGHPARYPARCGQQGRAAAPAGPQRDHSRGLAVRGAEAIRESQDGAAVRAAEAINGLVGVADHDKLTAVASQRMQELFLSRVGVLVLIHQDDVVGAPFAVPDRGPTEQAPGDPDNLGIVIGGHRGKIEPGGVPVEEAACGLPVIAAVLPA